MKSLLSLALGSLIVWSSDPPAKPVLFVSHIHDKKNLSQSCDSKECCVILKDDDKIYFIEQGQLTQANQVCMELPSK